MIISLFRSGANLERRVFIKGIGSVSLGFIAAATLGGCEHIFERIRRRPVRRRLGSNTAEVSHDIDIYKEAVMRMQALPASDPRSWAAQAGLHGTVSPNVFNFCQHGTEHFFSWHRAYLFCFERICQKLTGEANWGLPYWNWNLDPAMHPAFTEAGGILNHPRNNTSVAGNAAFSDSTLGPMFSDPDFFTFGAQIEGTPHNIAHGVVGQNMVTGGSPLDPIFWAHHCMVDYCWAKWNLELGNSSPSDSAWQSRSWNHFVDGDGEPMEITAIATVLMPLLSYRYEESTIGGVSATGMSATRDLREVEERLRRGANVRTEVVRRVPVARGVDMRIGEPIALEVAGNILTSQLLAESSDERTFLIIRHARLPDTNDFFLRVYINQPDANPRTPTSIPSYAGSFAFFGSAGDHHQREGTSHGRTEFLVNVSDTIERLSRIEGLSNVRLSVQIVAVPATDNQFEQPSSRLTIENIEFVRSRVIVEAQDSGERD